MGNVFETIKEFVSSKVGTFPRLDWAAHQTTLSYQQERLQKYYDRMATDLLSPNLKEILDHARTDEARKEFPNYVRNVYPYSQEIALEASEIAFKILRRLQYV